MHTRMYAITRADITYPRMAHLYRHCSSLMESSTVALLLKRHITPSIISSVCNRVNFKDSSLARKTKLGHNLIMSASDEHPGVTPGGAPAQPGESTKVESMVLDKGAQLMQSLKPVKHIGQHINTFAMYSHDMNRQIETHHYVSRLNQDVLQCPVYDSDDSNARLIGVEFIISDKLFETLDPEEQKLWHSHAYEIKAGLWVNPGVPEAMQKPELRNLAKTYGKFWCTWQTDRGDMLPMGAPALMVSPQGVNMGKVRPELVKRRDDKYRISNEELKSSRMEIEEPEWINPTADYWKQSGKGFAIEVQKVPMKCP